jgi:hypothetical protein
MKTSTEADGAGVSVASSASSDVIVASTSVAVAVKRSSGNNRGYSCVKPALPFASVVVVKLPRNLRGTRPPL